MSGRTPCGLSVLATLLRCHAERSEASRPPATPSLAAEILPGDRQSARPTDGSSIPDSITKSPAAAICGARTCVVLYEIRMNAAGSPQRTLTPTPLPVRRARGSDCVVLL